MSRRSIVPFGWGGSMLPGRTANGDPFVRLWHEIDQLFSNVARGTGLAEWPQAGGQVGLPVEVADSGTELKVVAELPGVDEKDVSVELQGDALTIRGEKAEEERKDEGYYLAERRYGAFTRTLRLPYAVEADQVQAAFKNGVLTVTLPKPAELQQAKRIEVKTAA